MFIVLHLSVMVEARLIVLAALSIERETEYHFGGVASKIVGMVHLLYRTMFWLLNAF